MRKNWRISATICLLFLIKQQIVSELVTNTGNDVKTTINDVENGSTTTTSSNEIEKTSTTTILTEIEIASTPITEKRVDELAEILKQNIFQIRQKHKKIDVVFLLDASSSVGKNNFLSELKFVTKFLSDFNVSFNYTRVALVTFSSQGKIYRHVDHISAADDNNDKCKLLNQELPTVNFTGGGTFTAGALKEAKTILSKARRHSKKMICLITDGFSNGQNPLPVAEKIKTDNITIITFGIQSGNYEELYNISSYPNHENSFLLDGFSQFESLARKALHSDYRVGTSIRIKTSSFCDAICDKANETYSSCCDKNAECTCSTVSGHYSCVCKPGYYGSGLVDGCDLCPNRTYWSSWNFCRPCPDINHIILDTPAVNSSYCVCKSGFKANDHNRCEILQCPLLKPPEHGYFVKHPTGCGHVLNAACGARCKSGYQLVGSSIRLCQQNGTWSGTEPKCILKTCPRLPVPFYGMAVCRNPDLSLFFDYTARNDTFMDAYNEDDRRVTENMPVDTECNFKCGPGFTMTGSSTRNCLLLSKWDGIQTGCKQILCPPIREVKFGQYDPTDCSEQKQAHGTSCTLTCSGGFKVEKGPETKICGGKKTGIWSKKNQHPKCVDISPPHIDCPKNITLALNSSSDFILFKDFPDANVTDNSDEEILPWLKPAVNEIGVKLTYGNHTFLYVAQDASKNIANCSFTITVNDVTPPTIENCVNPTPYIIPTSPNASKNDTFIDWDPPLIFDNSNAEVNVTQSLQAGQIGIGKYQVIYSAIDLAGNQNECILNITVNAAECKKLPEIQNGQTVCAKNATHTWCELNCDNGYTTTNENSDEHFDSLVIHCEHSFAKWSHNPIPECSKFEIPEFIEQVISIDLNVNTNICNGTNETLQNQMNSEMKKMLCNESEDCEIITELPNCDDVEKRISAANATNNQLLNNSFYHVIKRREIERGNKDNVMQIRVYTRVSKKLGKWNSTLSRNENIDNIKDELKTYHSNGKLRDQLSSLKINVKHLNLDESPLCRNGSVLKKDICIECPRGSYHNKLVNSCHWCPLGTFNNASSQMICQSCPLHYSTRKIGAKYSKECFAQCSPGTMAKQKIQGNGKIQSSLMPFCRKCPPGHYQPNYDSIKCLKCPSFHSSRRGSTLLSDCHQMSRHACHSNPHVCGPYGICESVPTNVYLYNCICEENYIGSHCERQLNLCASSPCMNQGRCEQISNRNYICHCSQKFTGEYCEIEVDACTSSVCHNSGTCIESDHKLICECQSGYTGDYCEIRHNFCTNNPCESGECVNTNDGFKCECPPGVIGRRCHLRPCDYLPCHRNSQCIDLRQIPTTKNSYKCQCPKGLKAYDCSQIDSPCDRFPCRNNGVCTPNAIRKPFELQSKEEYIDEDVYEQFTCKCPPYFYGKNCEIFTTPDFVLEFAKPAVHNFVELTGPKQNLSEISFCTWLQTNDSMNYGTILSYASESSDNMLTLTDYNGFVLYVNGRHIITDIILNDGEWHFICVSWISYEGRYEIYVDGVLRDSGINLSSGDSIEANGTIIIGQEQDSIGTSFSESESFVGRVAYFDIWNHRISLSEMFEYYTTCEPYQGNLYAWADFKINIKGNVKIKTSPFCRQCPKNLGIFNGYIRYLSNRAFHYCYEGYRLHGPSVRDCLRTSQWSLPVPSCRSIQCGYLPNLVNGNVYTEKTVYGELATYSCNENFNLVGDNTRLCQSNGKWSGNHPECISNISCYQIDIPTNGKLTYANERGKVRSNLQKYPMGTFVEIECINNTMIQGESFLTCTETGSWDFAVPLCNPIKLTTIATTSTEMPTVSSTMSTTEITSTKMSSSTSTEGMAETSLSSLLSSSSSMTMPTVSFSPSIRLGDNQFWKNWKRLLLSGCSNFSVCNCFKNPKWYADLSSFIIPQNDEYKDMDIKLFKKLTRAVNALENDKIISNELDIENLLPFLLNEKIDENSNVIQIETVNIFRFVLHLYVDTILLNENKENINGGDITWKIQNLIKKIVTYAIQNNEKFHESCTKKRSLLSSSTERINYSRNYRSTKFIDDELFQLTSTTEVMDATAETTNVPTEITSSTSQATTESTSTNSNQNRLRSTEENYSLDCNWDLLVSKNDSVFISNVIDSNGNVVDIDFIREYGVPQGTKVFFDCMKGSQSEKDILVECRSDGVWSAFFDCETITCECPPQISNIKINWRTEKVYVYGFKLYLKCNKGYELDGVGESFIQCKEDGKWSEVNSKCSKIECKRPLLPKNAKIIHGNSYTYEDNLVIECENGQRFETFCQNNKLWAPEIVCSLS